MDTQARTPADRHPAPADELTALPDLLARQAALHADAVAFVDGDRRVGYAGFDTLVRRAARWLAARGVRRGDRVAVWLVNRLEWAVLYFALARLGAALVTVNTRYRSHELAHILEKSRPSLLVLQLDFRRIDFPAVLRDVPAQAAASLRAVVVVDADERMPATVLGRPAIAFDLDLDLDRAADPDPEPDTPAGTADDPSILFTTSGTTSGPKLVVHRQRSVCLHAQRAGRAHGLAQDAAVLLATLPLCGTFGFVACMAAFAAAAPVVLMDTFDGPEAAALIARHRVTHVFGSDEMFRRLIDCGEGATPFPSARVFGFASFHPGVAEWAAAAWERGIPLIGLYGSSEVQALFALQARELPMAERLRGGGLPAGRGHRVDLRVRDIDTGALLPPGASGAIQIRADTNFSEYFDDPQATARAVDAEGFFDTGDVGHLREDGSFVFETRRGDAMRLGGYLVGPTEIEDVLKTVPGVLDVQVVSIDIGTQARAVAFVVAAPGRAPTEAALRQAAAAVLAPFKVPAHVWLVDAFPTTQSANGTKIQRVKLRDMALQRIGPPDRPHRTPA
ncbi:AMP-binding protein [Xylophilus sp. Kf1]|nr:AMP-binding protein [Xylophilus sp. Kf1]